MPSVFRYGFDTVYRVTWRRKNEVFPSFEK